MTTAEVRKIIEEVLKDHLDDESSEELADQIVERLDEEGLFEVHSEKSLSEDDLDYL
jgi:predicted transcriptional regulator YheO